MWNSEAVIRSTLGPGWVPAYPERGFMFWGCACSLPQGHMSHCMHVTGQWKQINYLWTQRPPLRRLINKVLGYPNLHMSGTFDGQKPGELLSKQHSFLSWGPSGLLWGQIAALLWKIQNGLWQCSLTGRGALWNSVGVKSVSCAPSWTLQGVRHPCFRPTNSSKKYPRKLWHPEVSPICFQKALLEVVPSCQKTTE